MYTIDFDKILEAQFDRAGDTQYINAGLEDNSTYIVNKLWLKSFCQINSRRY